MAQTSGQSSSFLSLFLYNIKYISFLLYIYLQAIEKEKREADVEIPTFRYECYFVGVNLCTPAK